MIKCPNCGSTAQVKIISKKLYTYCGGSSKSKQCQCGCGYKFLVWTDYDDTDTKWREIIEEVEAYKEEDE
jgi:hypothetical protein